MSVRLSLDSTENSCGWLLTRLEEEEEEKSSFFQTGEDDSLLPRPSALALTLKIPPSAKRTPSCFSPCWKRSPLCLRLRRLTPAHERVVGNNERREKEEGAVPHFFLGVLLLLLISVSQSLFLMHFPSRVVASPPPPSSAIFILSLQGFSQKGFSPFRVNFV